ncbi:MAG: YjfB family protein [Defluviitaleaceae bacterium]|nr:YjfB family protein [Defluviitaleaceae bacterium]
MDIPAVSMELAEMKLMQGVGIGMMKKAIELTEQTGEMLVEMMNDMAVGEGGKVDIKI